MFSDKKRKQEPEQSYKIVNGALPTLSPHQEHMRRWGMRKCLCTGDIQDIIITALMYDGENAHLGAQEVTCGCWKQWMDKGWQLKVVCL